MTAAVQPKIVKWRDMVLDAAMLTFKKTIEGREDSDSLIKAFTAIRRDNGTLFFTDVQQKSISASATPKMNKPVAEVRNTDLPPLPPILKVKALVPQLLSGCTVREIAKLASMHSYFHAEGLQAIIEQLKIKTSYTWQELNDYQQALGLATVKELLTLFPVISSKTKSLNLSNLNINSISFEQLIKFFPHLTSVNFEDRDELTDAAVASLADKCRHLTSVNFTYCHNLTDAAVASLADKCPNLTSVNFACCENLTDNAVASLADKCPNLTSVNFAGCYDLTDAAVASLADKCRHLTSVNFTNCHNLTDNAVASLADKCPNLTSVNFSCCDGLADAAVASLAGKCRHLTSVDFTYCNNLTDAAARALARSCLKLTSISACDNLESAFKRYRKEFSYGPTSAIETLSRKPDEFKKKE